jgi:hypothetical protein
MIGLLAAGTLKYNGFTFDGTSQVKVNIEYVEDEAERTVILQKHTLTVRAIVATVANSTADSQLANIRLRLSQQGQELIFINRGFGVDLIVNPVAPGGWDTYRNDVRWGPKPKILHWEAVGSNNAVEIEWQVETCISLCDGSTPPLLALNYLASYSIDARGLTTRTISGYYEVAQTRSGRTIPISSDAYRSIIAVNLPILAPIPSSNWTWEGVGFQRSTNWTTSLNKSREDFVIVDKQIPSNHAFPDYAVNARGRHRAQFKRPRKNSGGLWNRHTISMELELAEGINPAVSVLIFSNIVNTRLLAANKDKNGAALQRTMFEEFTIEEDVFGRVSAFHIEYRVLGGPDALRTFVDTSGMWKPLGTLWSSWATSMASTFAPYGSTGIKTLAANDSITDLCGLGTTSPLANEAVNTVAQPTFPNVAQLDAIYPRNIAPRSDVSFKDYQNAIYPYSNSPTVRQSILQAPTADVTANATGGAPSAITQFAMAAVNTTADILQMGGARRMGALIVGYAERYAYPVQRPSFSKIGTMDGAKEVDATFSNRIVGNALGIPLYRGEWAIRYDLPNSPTTTMPPKNYEQGVESNGTITP